jgi:hypothetical protein
MVQSWGLINMKWLLIILGIIISSECLAAQGSIWIHPDSLAARPTSGLEWDAVFSEANATSFDTRLINHCDSFHDVQTLAAALVAKRLGDAAMRTKAVNAILTAINNFSPTSCSCDANQVWLCVGRNLGAYVIAADILGLRGGLPGSDSAQVQAFFTTFLTRTDLPGGSPGIPSYTSASNADAQVAFVHAAIAAYLGDSLQLGTVRTRFRRFCGDRTSPHTLTIPGSVNQKDWIFDLTDPVGIHDAHRIRNCCRYDGAIGHDMGRNGQMYSCNPAWTQYPWVNLEGSIPCAIILERNNAFDAKGCGTNALRRAAEYLWYLRTINAGGVGDQPDGTTCTGLNCWFYGIRAEDIVHLINAGYGTDYPTPNLPIGRGRTIGFTRWTHPTNW